jgi:hypothetical protein
MTIKLFLLLTITLTLTFVSCNRAIPSGFWKDYKTNFLVSNISDQGPHGGHCAIYWKCDKTSTFDTKSVLDFAIKNGWALTDSSEFDQNHTIKWMHDDKKIFPLSSTGFNDTIKNISTYNYFPRWFGGQLKLYKFKTGWVTIEPGTDNSIEENGFVLLNQDKSELAVYHLWGE